MRNKPFLMASLLAVTFFLSACNTPQSAQPLSTPQATSSLVKQDISIPTAQYYQIAEQKLRGIKLNPDECYWFEYEDKYFCVEGTIYPLQTYGDIVRYHPEVKVPEQIHEIPFQSITFSLEDKQLIRTSDVLPQDVVLEKISPVASKDDSLAGITVQYSMDFTVVAFKKDIQMPFLINIKEEIELAEDIKVITNDSQQTMLNWNSDGYSFFLLVNQGTQNEKTEVCHSLYETGILEQFSIVPTS